MNTECSQKIQIKEHSKSIKLIFIIHPLEHNSGLPAINLWIKGVRRPPIGNHCNSVYKELIKLVSKQKT